MDQLTVEQAIEQTNKAAQDGDAPDSTGPMQVSPSDTALSKAAPKDDVRSDKSAAAKTWNSRLSWRITLTVFATILLVQAAILAVTLPKYEAEKLQELREVGRSAVAPLVRKTHTGDARVPIAVDTAEQLFETTPVKGLAIYGLDNALIRVYGAPTIMNLKGQTDLYGMEYHSTDKTQYEVVYQPADLRKPYNIVASLDSVGVVNKVNDYLWERILIVLCLSAFVTNVLMLALGQWLLEPIMILRNNLLSAVRNPEKPDLTSQAKESRDEVGLAIRAANDLILQNANNLVRLRSQAEDKIHRLAYYDTLTNLPNRTLFLETLETAISEEVIGTDRRLVVLSIDIDHFKDINDTMGHSVGDKLLEAVAQRIANSTPEGAMVARASADEFMVMAMIDEEMLDTSRIVDNVFSSLSEPICIMQEQFQIRVSIGVAHCPDDGLEAGHIMKNADIALNRSKEEGRDTVRYYSEDFDRAVQQRFQLLRDLRVALDEEQLELFYHPQFDLKTGALIGAEALLRWFRPDNSREGGSYISPVEFIPIAEQSGLIVPIGEWVIKEACATNKKWQDEGVPPFRIAVNLSGVQFHRGDIVSFVEKTLEETGLEPHLLELEVTESVFMDDIDTTIDLLNQLHSLGVEIAVDDFGTGYSSLSYLRQFPIDRLKIDQSFTRNALVNSDDMAITRTIINLGHSLGLKVIAEGVETQDHEDFLMSEDCDEVQGFKYSKPIPKAKLRDFAMTYRGSLSNMFG